MLYCYIKKKSLRSYIKFFVCVRELELIENDIKKTLPIEFNFSQIYFYLTPHFLSVSSLKGFQSRNICGHNFFLIFIHFTLIHSTWLICARGAACIHTIYIYRIWIYHCVQTEVCYVKNKMSVNGFFQLVIICVCVCVFKKKTFNWINYTCIIKFKYIFSRAFYGKKLFTYKPR